MKKQLLAVGDSFTYDADYPKGKANHPLEKGHERIANEIHSRI